MGRVDNDLARGAATSGFVVLGREKGGLDVGAGGHGWYVSRWLVCGVGCLLGISMILDLV